MNDDVQTVLITNNQLELIFWEMEAFVAHKYCSMLMNGHIRVLTNEP